MTIVEHDPPHAVDNADILEGITLIDVDSHAGFGTGKRLLKENVAAPCHLDVPG